jgi:Ser-tRNA(Ala) deacylase AlaX
MNTLLLYLSDWNQLTATATVTEVTTYKEKVAIVLDQTIFYPQGGGQPWDTGSIIKNANAVFMITEVRFENGIVYHIGTMTSDIKAGDTVTCSVDEPRRTLNSRLHSGGHLLDMALSRLGINWKPGKGYHFPEGPYVEYAGSLEGLDKEKLKNDIEAACAALIATNTPTTISFLPEGVVNGKPARVVLYGSHQIPCGGTHVNSLGEIGQLTIRKIKQEKENIRVGYDIIR